MRCYRPPYLWRALLLGLAAFFSSCAFHNPKAFRVIPENPAYLMRSPDSQDTPFPEILKDYNGFEPAITGNHPAQVSVKRLFSGGFAVVGLDYRDPASLRFPLLPGDEISWK